MNINETIQVRPEGRPKLHVLFVDDERDLLQLLQVGLSDMQDCWEMSFASSGARALELMAQTAFDVVVSDLNMPGMTGLDLLQRVRVSQPAAARMLFCGAPDPALLLHWTGLIHQFLPKPGSMELIKASVRRSAAARSSLSQEVLWEKITQLEGLPSLPSLYAELVQKLNSGDAPLADVASTISKDLGMTAQILRMVNSAWFSPAQPVSNVSDAIGLIGLEKVKYLVLVAGIFKQFEARKLGGVCLETLWRHCGRVAETAQIIAQSERVSRQLTDDAFLAGLLHDVGKLVLASSYPDPYQEIVHIAQTRRIEWVVAERDALGFDHAEVGGCLLRFWGLPPAVTEAVSLHHFPSRAADRTFTALTAVHVAEVLVQTQSPGCVGSAAPQVDQLYLSNIGRAEALDYWRGLLSNEGNAEL